MASRSPDHEVNEVLELLPALRRALRPRLPQGYEHTALSPAQIQLVVELANSGTQPMSELAARLGVSFSTATELVDKLVRAGQIVRTKSERDRRQTLVQVTQDAEELAAAVMAERRTRVERALGGLAGDERSVAVRLLRGLLQSLN